MDYKKKIALCEKLGANKFQKVVFKVENLKFKILKKFCPRFIEYFDKFCDRKRNRELKKAKTDAEKKTIIDKYRKQKLLMRKEFNREQNRNYHIDPNKPMEMLYYLNWNKEVHQKGMIKNFIAIPVLITAISFGFSLAIPMIVIEAASLFINFQCINIQNCNIYRFKEKEEKLKNIQEKKTKRNIERYSEAAQVIDRSLKETVEIPSIEDIVNNIKTPEELQQLKKLVQETLNTSRAIESQKSVGGK